MTAGRCWKWAIPIGALLACVVAIGIKLTFVPQYQANHWLEAPDDLVFNGVTPTVTELVNTERPLFFSSVVLDPVLTDPALRKAPSLSDPDKAELNIRKNLSLEGGGTKSRLIVNYQDTDPAAAAMVANAIAESYLRTRESYDNERVEALVRWLEPEVERQEQKVDEMRTIVQSLSQATLGSVPEYRLLLLLDDENRMALLNRLTAQITELRIQLRVLENQQKRDGQDLPQTQAEQVSKSDAEREALAARLSVLEEMYKEERGRLEQFSGETTKLEFARQELELETEALQKLRRSVIAVRDEHLASQSVRTLSVAQAPKTPVETFPIKKMLAASGATFLLTCFLGFLWEIKAQRVTDSRDVEDSRQSPSVGEESQQPGT